MIRSYALSWRVTGVSVAQKLIAGETNYLDPFSQVFPLGEIVDVRCDDDDAITLVGQLARKVLGVLFNASDVREVVGGKLCRRCRSCSSMCYRT